MTVNGRRGAGYTRKCGATRSLLRAVTTTLVGFLILYSTGATATDNRSRWAEDYFPNIELTNQHGQKVRFYDDLIKGKVVAINFIFTSCQAVCPAETARLRQVQQALGDRVGRDVFFYSISIDPDRDTPEVLKAYAAKFGVGPGWQFLTGSEEEVIMLQKKLGLWVPDAQEVDPKDHSINLIVGNETTGRWNKRSSFDDPKVLARLLGDSLHNYRFAPDAEIADYVTADKRIELADGEELFNARCKACHSVTGSGIEMVGPDLLGVVDRRDPVWLRRWIKEPDRMLEEQDPLAMALFRQHRELRMPNLGLSDKDVESLIRYLDHAGKTKPAVTDANR